MIALRRVVVAFMLIALAGTAVAQDHPGRGGGDRPNRQEQNQQGGSEHEQGGPGVLSLLPGDAVSEHSIDTPSGKLAYTATAGTFSLFNQSGDRSAAVFYTAYVAKTDNHAARPLTFVFNGGPGAASAFLHLGVVGPRIAQFGMAGHDGADVRLVDNPDTWLAFTDLVLIDPVGTGWSRPAKPDGGNAFWGVHGDAESMAKVIALYVAKNGRVSSPKFILGESYGGFRAAKVARTVQSEQGIVISGILMLSPLLEGAFQFGGDRFALGAALQLPSLAAAEMERKGTFSKAALAAGRAFRLDRLSVDACRPAVTGRCGQELLRTRRANDRDIGGRHRGIARLHRATTMSRICTSATTRSSATTMRRSHPTILIRNRRRHAAPIRFSTASCVPTAARSSLTRATNSASRPISPTICLPPIFPANGTGRGA